MPRALDSSQIGKFSPERGDEGMNPEIRPAEMLYFARNGPPMSLGHLKQKALRGHENAFLATCSVCDT